MKNENVSICRINLPQQIIVDVISCISISLKDSHKSMRTQAWTNAQMKQKQSLPTGR